MRLEENALITDFYAVDGRVSGRQAIDQAGAAAFIIVRLGQDKYAIFAAKDLRSFLSSWQKWDDPLDL